MRFGMLSCGFLLAGSLLSPFALAAQISGTQGDAIGQSPSGNSVYITDQIKVTLRSGPGLQYKILNMLATGDVLTSLKSVSNGYTEVQLQDGTQGWVLSRYLIDNPTAAQRLSTYQAQLAKTKQTLAITRKNLNDEQTRLAQLESAQKQLESGNSSLKQKYENLLSISQHAVNLQKANKSLTEQAQKTSQKMVYLSQENKSLKRDSDVRWFLAGGGVLLGGLLLGLWLPKLARKRRDTWFN